MILVILIVALVLLALVAFLITLSNKTVIKVIDVDDRYARNPIKTVETNIDFSHVIFQDQTIEAVRDYDLFIIKGNKFSNFSLSDGRTISLEDGDCILVNTRITYPWVDRFKLFLVTDENLGVVLKTADEIILESPIVGTVFAKIPRKNIENLKWK